MKSVNLNLLPFAKNFADLVDNFFHEFSIPSGVENFWMPSRGYVPVNIKETPDAIQMEVVAPGFEKNDFKVEVENNMLIISANKKSTQEEERGNEIRREYTYHSFKRTFALEEKIDATKIKASYINGVLVLNLPKKEEIKQTVTEIQIN